MLAHILPLVNTLVALHHVTLISGTGDEPVPDATVAMRDGRIIYAGEARTWLPSLQEDILNMDFPGKYLLPGLIDCHVHLARSGEAHGRLEGDDGAVALRMLLNARRNLAAGITTVRDTGGWNEIEFAVRDAIQRGDFCGPRLILSGRCITGSEAAAAQYAGRYRLAKGADEVRKAAREVIRRGADVIKLSMTGALLVQGDTPAAKLMSVEELNAAVDEAVKAERRLAAHAHGTEGIRQAVLAGVHSIEHGTYLYKDRSLIEEMKKRGAFLVPALNAGRVLAEGSVGRVPAWIVGRMNETHEAAKRSLRLAYQAGVPIAMGSNAGTPLNRHGENGLEVLSMQRAGMKPMDALMSATLIAARALGRQSEIGSIEEGKLADLLVLDANPLEDLGRLADKKQIRAVFLEGKLAARQPTDAYPRTILVRDGLLIG
jgi:imidazolonepropionase-like amidohydrolase